jgi:hypothetical protein
MIIDMRLSCLRIKIETNIHALHPSDSDEYQRPNAVAQPLPEAEVERSETEAVGSWLQPIVRR